MTIENEVTVNKTFYYKKSHNKILKELFKKERDCFFVLRDCDMFHFAHLRSSELFINYSRASKGLIRKNAVNNCSFVVFDCVYYLKNWKKLLA